MKVNERVKNNNYYGVILSCSSDESERSIYENPEHILIYVYSGEQIIEDRNKIVKVKAGQCVFVRRNHQLVMYKNSCGKEQYQGIALTFSRKLLRDLYSKLNKTKLPKDVVVSDQHVFTVEPRPDISSLFQSLIPYFSQNRQPSEEVVHLKLLEGVYALLNNSTLFYPLLFDFTEPWKIDILDFMNEHYKEDLTVEQLASYTGRSLATFKRDFKKVSNLTPQRWVMKKRLEAAYLKIKAGQIKVKEVYWRVGFKNPNHFSTAFKRHYGITPTQLALTADL